MSLRDLWTREITIKNPPIEPLFIAPPKPAPTPRFTSNLTKKQENRIIAAVIAEAGGEKPEGRQAVLNSAINLIKTNPRYYGRNLWEAISKPAQYTGFSLADPNYVEVKEYLDNKSKKLTAGRAQQIKEVQGFLGLAKKGQLTDVTGGATHYINPKKATDFSWIPKAEKRATIGEHDFYYLKQ